MVKQTLDHPSFEQVLADYFGNVGDLNPRVELGFGIDYHYRAEGAKPEAAGLYHADFLI
jgi:hypothetical protein